MCFKKIFIFFSVIMLSLSAFGQKENKVQISGAFQGSLNYFIKDVKIGASGTPQYEENPLGVNAWLNLNANFTSFRGGMRFDFFDNTNLLNPTSSYTARGLGIWFLERDFKNVFVRVGSIYNQIGSGIIYRSYEERPLLIDNALKGVQLRYNVNDDWTVNLFGGKQKFLFGSQSGILGGTSIDGYFALGENDKFSFVPGFGILGKRLGDDSVDKLVSVLRNYIGSERIDQFNYNSLAISLYNSVNFGKYSWYFEYAHKFPEVFFNPLETTTKVTGATSTGRFIKNSGTVFYSTLSYARKGLGLTIEAKRTQNFDFRTDPTLLLNNGLIGFLPPMNHITTYRLTSRYNPATQYTSELAFQIDANIKINKKFSLNLNASNISTLDYDLLYREFYADLLFKANKKFISHWGLQTQWYNQSIYEGKPQSITPMVRTITPYMDLVYKFTRKKSLKVESQFMYSEQDYGSWLFLLGELGLAPHWNFELSAMYNIIPNQGNPNIPEGAGGMILYPTAGITYKIKQSRFSFRFVKQVEGVVCTGGICRLEPAFSGFKFDINSSF